jgi:hypothetical protein
MNRHVIEPDPIAALEHFRQTIDASKKAKGAKVPINTNDPPIKANTDRCNLKTLTYACGNTHAAITHNEYARKEAED